jgi:hypothetical protein
MQETIKGFKAMNSDMTCRGFKFEETIEVIVNGVIKQIKKEDAKKLGLIE